MYFPSKTFLTCSSGFNGIAHTITYRFVTELLHPAVEEGGLSHRCGDISGYIEFEVGVTADVAVLSSLV